MNMWIKSFFMFFVIQQVFSKFVGDKCSNNDGICELFSKCEVAKSQIILNQRHNLKRCGFAGREEIVCCPTTTSKFGTTTTSTRTIGDSEDDDLRPADRECKRIKESTTPPLNTYIIGGVKASAGEFPHMVALGFREESTGLYKFDCGGSLISNQYVLTAAHCVVTRSRIRPSIARMGVVELCADGGEACAFDATTDERIIADITHPNYTVARKYDDIALLRLDKPVSYKVEVAPVCLYSSEDEPGATVVATGFGQYNTTSSQKSNNLLQANLTYVPQRECRKRLPSSSLRMPQGIIDGQICAVHPMRDTCQGDSGGPLMATVSSDSFFRLVGVTSTGGNCGSGQPAVYTAVSKYLDWIESVVWPQQDDDSDAAF